jgi:hypothetical protein
MSYGVLAFAGIGVADGFNSIDHDLGAAAPAMSQPVATRPQSPSHLTDPVLAAVSVRSSVPVKTPK